ncbi:unnamed protein product [Miscanthus lutarioriparius]|uniref:Fe2OG dioxygenase domain-containing protein n=1 Tax=Miscanthus lutarioriparius TaxID=422564 RepID=A0A811SBF7_9POAL|nr:unnamed protein product [Miscanthus lutarioriparius]
MDPGFLAKMMGVTRGFFNLPLDEKQKYSNLANGKEFRNEGYGNDMVLSEDQVLDWCDRLYLIVEPESRIIRSLWPAQPPAFADVLRQYTARCREIAGVVLANVAKLLGLQEGRFVGMMDEGVQKPNDDDGVWYNVPIVPNALLVNVGDLTEIMSNGLFRSPMHRAVTNAESDRVSLAMFFTLDTEKEIEPLPELVDDKRPRRYRKTTTKDYLAVLFERFTRGERALDTVKIDLNDD